MNKKVVFIFGIILILCAGGVFWWQQDKIENYIEIKEFKKLFALPQDFAIQKTIEGNYLINAKDGLKLKIPENWEVATGTSSLGFVSDEDTTLFSPDFNFRPPKGCMITIQIIKARDKKDKKDFAVKTADEVREMIILYKQEKELNRYPSKMVIIIDQKEALKEIYPPHEGLITTQYTHIDMPTYNKVFSFDFISSSKECDEEFDNLLKTISIQ